MEKIYYCKGCGKSFDNGSKLGGHTRGCYEHHKHKADLEQESLLYENICECGRKFKTPTSLKSHARFCKKYIKKNKLYDENGNYIPNTKNLVDGKYQCVCGKVYDNRDSFGGHASHCQIYHDTNNMVNKLRPHQITKTMAGWEKFSEDERAVIHKKSGITFSKNMADGVIINGFKDRKHSEKTLKQIRESTIKYLKTFPNWQGPRYNNNGCEYIDELNKRNGWSLQHAMNGGETEISGYWVDGYDEMNKIIFEYDEQGHYIDYRNNILKESDIKRQRAILGDLGYGWKFYRYNEPLDLFYRLDEDSILNS